jgi:hypothetical protein
MTTASRGPKRFTLWQIFVAPLAIGLVTTAGLAFALVGDGWWDWLSWLALALPIAVTAWYVWRRR